MRLMILLLMLPLLTGITWDRACQTGPGIMLRPDTKEGAKCGWQDLDHDGDVDQNDYGLFQRHEPPTPMVYVFVLDANLLGAIDPEEYVRQVLNARYAQRR